MNIKIALTLSAAALALSGCELLEPSKAETFIAPYRGHSVQLTFQPSGNSNGVEYYYPNSNDVLYLNKDGRCVTGYYDIDGESIYYHYPNTELYGDFHVKKRGEELVPYSRNNITYQTYDIVSNEPIDCTPIN